MISILVRPPSQGGERYEIVAVVAAEDLLTGCLDDPSAADQDERKARLSPPVLD